MKGKSNLLILLVAVALLTSCVSPKKFVYLQDMELGHGYPYDNKYEAVIHNNDRLDITVSSKSPELAMPFNSNGGAVSMGTDGSVTQAGTTGKRGYRVDANGDINFPILGKLHVEGLTVSEVTELVRNGIIEGKYIKDPSVSAEILNFKYSVLGAAGSNVYTVDGDRITLLEAIAKAGDITSRGRVNKVAVIREEDGQRVMYMHDLRSKEIFESPCYYLQQNDIVYVEPKYRKQDNEDRSWKYITTALSALSAIITVLWYVK